MKHLVSLAIIVVLLSTATFSVATLRAADDRQQSAQTTESRVDELLAQMTLEEKIGQMTLVEKNSIDPADVTAYAIGAVFMGGSWHSTGADGRREGERKAVRGYGRVWMNL